MFALVLIFGLVTEVSVAAIGLLGVMISAWLTTQRSARKNAVVAAGAASEAVTRADDIQNKIGTPNGKGNVVQMLELIVDRIDDLAEGQAAMSAGLGDVRERMSFMEGSLGTDHRPKKALPPPGPGRP